MIQKFLDKINGRWVRFTGLVIMVLAGVFGLHAGHRVTYLIALTIGVVSWCFPLLWNWLSNFADPKYWPSFVSLGFASCVAAHAYGGWRAVLFVGAVFTVLDGIYFLVNY